ncbi:MAG: Fic family protein [Candidatus Omnitrophica bacterium]|nr:Fic family protein [Candidatus Omnitrophota bacterium]
MSIELKTVDAIQFRKKLDSGRTGPCIFDCEDIVTNQKEEYVVKLKLILGWGSGNKFAAHIPQLMRDFEENILYKYTPCLLKKDDIALALAEVHVELVLIHPFREGNGRLSRLLAILMALQAGLPILDFSDIQGKRREVYFKGVQQELARNYKPMEDVFKRIIAKSVSRVKK